MSQIGFPSWYLSSIIAWWKLRSAYTDFAHTNKASYILTLDNYTDQREISRELRKFGLVNRKAFNIPPREKQNAWRA